MSWVSVKVNVKSNLVVRAPGGSAVALTPGRSRLGLPIVLQHEHGLEQRLPAEHARRIEDFHQPFEGQILVGIGLQAGGADAAE